MTVGISGLMPGVPCERRDARTCSLRVWRPARTVLVSEVTGHLDVSTARALEAYIPRIAQEDGLVTGFHDWRAMTDYEAESRNLLTESILRSLRYIDVAHIAAHSRLVAFGVRAAGALIGKLKLHDTSTSFFDALTRTLHERVVRASVG